jgi:hypothetical protein
MMIIENNGLTTNPQPVPLAKKNLVQVGRLDSSEFFPGGRGLVISHGFHMIHLTSTIRIPNSPEGDLFPQVMGIPKLMLMFDRQTPEGTRTTDSNYPLYIGRNFMGIVSWEKIESTEQVQNLYDDFLRDLPKSLSLEAIRAVHREASKNSTFLKKLTAKPLVDPYFTVYAVLSLGFTFPIMEVFHFILNPYYEIFGSG